MINYQEVELNSAMHVIVPSPTFSPSRLILTAYSYTVDPRSYVAQSTKHYDTCNICVAPPWGKIVKPCKIHRCKKNCLSTHHECLV